jgi:hypothetical protein
MNRININPHCLIGIWPLLGFKRGMNSYDHDYSKKNVYIKQQSSHLFIDKIGWGICSAIAYINPCTIPFMLYKEVYRLEVNIRGLEEEKKTDYYNRVL